MTKRILISAFALAVGLSACNESALPTDPEQLGNPAKELDGSKFGQVLSEEFAAAPAVVDPVSPAPALTPSDKQLPDHNLHIDEGDDKSKWVPTYYKHIKDDHNKSKYKHMDYEHIKEGDDKTKYKPEKWVHYNGSRTADKTKYIPEGYQHNASGANETRYSKPSSSSTVGDDIPVGDGTVGEDSGSGTAQP